MIFPLGAVLFLLEPKTRGSSLIYDSVSSSPRPRQPTTTISEPLRMRTGVCPRLKSSVRTVASGAPSVVPRRLQDYWMSWVVYFRFSFLLSLLLP